MIFNSLILLLFLAMSNSLIFKKSIQFSRKLIARAKVEVADSAAIADGKSLTVKTPIGEVIIYC